MGTAFGRRSVYVNGRSEPDPNIMVTLGSGDLAGREAMYNELKKQRAIKAQMQANT